MAGAYGLDFGAVAAVASAMGVMTPMLAEVLPDYEAVLIRSLRSSTDGDDDAEG